MSGKLDIEHSTSWSLIWYVFKTGFRFLSNMILSRLLAPEMFGVAAIGNALLSGMSMLSDIGLRQSVIQSHREDEAFYQTAWTIQVTRGVMLFVLVLLLAVPVGYLYDSDDVATFMLIVAFSQLAMGLNNIELLREYKTAKLRRVAILDIVAAIIGLGTMVIWAFVQPSHIALAVGAVASTATLTLLTFVFFPGSTCRFRRDRDAAKEMLTFGKWVFVSTLLAFFVLQLDRLALGKLVSLELIGFYSIAWIWASIPSQVLGQWSGQVFYPVVSEAIKRNDGLSTIRLTRRAYVAIAVLISSVLFAASEILVAILYPASYAAVATLMHPLVGVALIVAIEQSYSEILIAYGKPKEKVFGQALSIILFLILLWPAFSYGGFDWFIYLLGAVGVIRVLWFAYRLHPFFRHDLVFDLLSFVAYVLGSHLLLELNSMRLDHTYQLAMSGIQSLAAAIASYWLYRKVVSWHVRAPINDSASA